MAIRITWPAFPATICRAARKAHQGTFSCGQPDLNDWFFLTAGHDERRNVLGVFPAADDALGVVGRAHSRGSGRLAHGTRCARCRPCVLRADAKRTSRRACVAIFAVVDARTTTPSPPARRLSDFRFLLVSVAAHAFMQRRNRSGQSLTAQPADRPLRQRQSADRPEFTPLSPPSPAPASAAAPASVFRLLPRRHWRSPRPPVLVRLLRRPASVPAAG
jgi:hypothetical protein